MASRTLAKARHVAAKYAARRLLTFAAVVSRAIGTCAIACPCFLAAFWISKRFRQRLGHVGKAGATAESAALDQGLITPAIGHDRTGGDNIAAIIAGIDASSEHVPLPI